MRGFPKTIQRAYPQCKINAALSIMASVGHPHDCPRRRALDALCVGVCLSVQMCVNMNMSV